MRGCGRSRGAQVVVCLGTSLTLAGGDLAAAEESNVRLRGAAGMAVRRAIEGASLRLEEPGCRQVFAEFSTAQGRPLQVVLDELGETPAGYLRRFVYFYDGSPQPRCASGEILGGTRPGSQVIYVCPVQFFATHRQDTLTSEVFIIHETLHSLGLGENPPASGEINQRVRRRCQARAPVAQRKPSAR